MPLGCSPNGAHQHLRGPRARTLLAVALGAACGTTTMMIDDDVVSPFQRRRDTPEPSRGQQGPGTLIERITGVGGALTCKSQRPKVQCFISF